MHLTLSLIIIISILYIGICCWKLKTWFPVSISSLVKAFKQEWIWILYIWFLGFALAHCYFISLPEDLKFLGWITSAFILAVGAMPLMMNCKEIDTKAYKLHCIVGSIGCIMTQVCTAIINLQWLMVWIAFPIFIAIPYFRKDRLTMVTELFCAVSTIGSLWFL